MYLTMVIHVLPLILDSLLALVIKTLSHAFGFFFVGY